MTLITFMDIALSDQIKTLTSNFAEIDIENLVIERKLQGDYFNNITFIVRKHKKYGITFLIFDEEKKIREYLSDYDICLIIAHFFKDNEIYSAFLDNIQSYFKTPYQIKSKIDDSIFFYNSIELIDKFINKKIQYELKSGIIIHFNDILNLVNLILLKESYSRNKKATEALISKFFSFGLLLCGNKCLDKQIQIIIEIINSKCPNFNKDLKSSIRDIIVDTQKLKIVFIDKNEYQGYTI